MRRSTFIFLLSVNHLTFSVQSNLQRIERQLQFAMQPNVTVVEGQPQRMVYDSVSMPEGSPWCRGDPTFWLIGHQLGETPYCYDSKKDTWTTPEYAVMDLTDSMNDLDGHPPNIDRHGCTVLDVNKDGLPDIVCAIGADRGEGFGYSELYLTQPDGSLEKVVRHGLQKYPSVRGRFTATLNNHVDPGNITHVFLSAFGTGRSDGLTNVHTMYRLIDDAPYFEEVVGPWKRHAKAKNLQVVDFNNDGRDDLIVMHNRNWTIFLEQEEGGTFKELNYVRNFRNNRLRSARVADIDLDGIPDLIVTTQKWRNKNKVLFKPMLKIFKGMDSPERFDFQNIFYKMELPFESPDIEILDVNSDGIPDIYVVLADETNGSYCGEPFPWRYRPYPPDNWTAPLDEAPDYLLLGQASSPRFLTIQMDFRLPGCGFKAEKFGNERTMILANADEGHPGTNSVLKWG